MSIEYPRSSIIASLGLTTASCHFLLKNASCYLEHNPQTIITSGIESCIGMFDNNSNNKRQTLNTQEKIQSFKLMSFCCRSSIQWKRIHSQHSKSSQAGPIYPFMWYMPIADSFTWSKIPKKKLSASVHQVQSTLFAYNWSIHCQKTFLFSSKTN
jgi:hypothetical protein